MKKKIGKLLGVCIFAIMTAACSSGGDDSEDVLVVITDTGKLQAALESLPPNNADTAYPIKVIVDLDANNNWQAILNALEGADRFVELDLSACTGMETFDPGTSNTGESKIVSLVLPDTSIATVAGPSNDLLAVFRKFSSLKEIKGNNITTIGDFSFGGFTEDGASLNPIKFQRFNFPALETIGQYAFYRCSSLTNVTMPDSVTTIGSYAFSTCNGLSIVTIGNNVTSIRDGAFINCSSLTNVTIPDSVTAIGRSAFAGCSSLTSVIIPSSVTTINWNLFYQCGLTSVTIPSSVTAIERSAFQWCPDLTSVTFNGTIPVANFSTTTFDGDLRTKFYATDSVNGTPGTYERVSGTGNTAVWELQ